MGESESANGDKVTMSNSSDSGTVPGEATSGIVMYESSWCGYCRAARRLLDAKGWPYQALNVDGNAQLRSEMMQRSGRTSVPQIFFGERHIGGFDDMAALEQDGRLDDAYASIK